MTKILLDTDIGTDIDDALALAYLLMHPDCELMGITTVTGQAVQRARIAHELCRVAGRSVPIYPGAENSLLIPQRQRSAWHIDSDQNFPLGEAVEFMRQTIRQHPHEITLLAIGALTNIALLFAVDPEIPGLLKGLVNMGGVFKADHPHAREWNMKLDPHAAAMVYRTPLLMHRTLGLDVTCKVELPREKVQAIQHPLWQAALELGEDWVKDHETVIFHDPLAAAAIFETDLITYEWGQVSVEVLDQSLLGKTTLSAERSIQEIAVDVHPERFFAKFWSVFK